MSAPATARRTKKRRKYSVARASLKRTDQEDLDSLPQFQAPPQAEFQWTDRAGFPAHRDSEIETVLRQFMGPYVRHVQWASKPTSLERFLHNAKLAIAAYEAQRAREANYNRTRATACLAKASNAMGAAADALAVIARWRELVEYLEGVYDVSQELLEIKASGPSPTKNPAIELEERLKRTGVREKSCLQFSPKKIISLLHQFDALATLALEKVKPSYDSRRNAAAETFTKEMVFAWMSATGRWPTYSRGNRRSRNPSPFAALLTLINRQILIAEVRSPVDFREHAVKSIRSAKASAEFSWSES